MGSPECCVRTLKHHRVGIFFNEWDGTNPLSGLTPELEEIRTIQSIETISINIAIYTNLNCPQRDEWGMLDKTLARPGWSKLLQVSLGILIYSYQRGDDGFKEEALKGLPEKQFPYLTLNALSFEFAVTSQSV